MPDVWILLAEPEKLTIEYAPHDEEQGDLELGDDENEKNNKTHFNPLEVPSMFIVCVRGYHGYSNLDNDLYRSVMEVTAKEWQDKLIDKETAIKVSNGGHSSNRVSPPHRHPLPSSRLLNNLTMPVFNLSP